MPSLLPVTSSKPVRRLAAGDTLIEQGAAGGAFFVLESGALTIERDGVTISMVDRPGSLLGEISVLLSGPATATVKAVTDSAVRVIDGARRQLELDPLLAVAVAEVLAGKLAMTTALLVELNKQHTGEKERGLLRRILTSLQRSAHELPGDPFAGFNERDWADLPSFRPGADDPPLR